MTALNQRGMFSCKRLLCFALCAVQVYLLCAVRVLCVYFMESSDWFGKLHNVNIGNVKTSLKVKLSNAKIMYRVYYQAEQKAWSKEPTLS